MRNKRPKGQGFRVSEYLFRQANLFDLKASMMFKDPTHNVLGVGKGGNMATGMAPGGVSSNASDARGELLIGKAPPQGWPGNGGGTGCPIRPCCVEGN